jgi:hypothetical protein
LQAVKVLLSRDVEKYILKLKVQQWDMSMFLRKLFLRKLEIGILLLTKKAPSGGAIAIFSENGELVKFSFWLLLRV